jgi:hypothetical protein
MSFDFILSPSDIIYRSSHTREKLLGEWYTFVAEDSYGYGPITGEFKTKKPLKLLDITKNSFYNDYRDNIIKYSKINPILNEMKMILLFPLGFPDSRVYTKYVEGLELTIEPLTNNNVELDTQYYGNRSRYSVMPYDLQLVLLLKEMYPEYDGIVSPIRLPNILRNGYHHSEISIFNRDNIELVKELPRLQSGGTMISQEPIRILGAINIDNEFTRDYINKMKEFHRTFKFIKEDNLIEKQFAPHVYVHSTMPVITDNKGIPNISNTPVIRKNRKTRKRKNN